MDFNPKAYFLIHQKQQKQHISLSIKATPFGCGCRDQLCDQPLNTHIFNYIIGPKHKSNVKTNCPKKYIVGSKHKCQDKICFIYFYTTGLGVTFDLVVFLHCILRKCLFVPAGQGGGNLGNARKKTFFLILGVPWSGTKNSGLFVPPCTNKAHLVQKRLELGSFCPV